MKVKWLAYFEDMQKAHAISWQAMQTAVDYGEIVYRSSEFLDRRWLVASYNEEYNVFVEDTSPKKGFERILAATFASKDRAVGFAAEMFLICCGRLKRKHKRESSLFGVCHPGPDEAAQIFRHPGQGTKCRSSQG